MSDDDDLFVLALGDIHAYHRCGLTPRGSVGSTGAEIPLNRYQEYLADCWDDQLRRLPQKIGMLLLNGDLTEGQNLKEEARALSETDPPFQVRGAVQLLSPLVERVEPFRGVAPVFVMRGSRYHTGVGGLYEEWVAASLGAVPNRFGSHTHTHLRCYVRGVYFDVAHHQSYTIRYRSMPLEREYAFLLERFGRERRKVPDEVVIIRSHVHHGFLMWRERGVTVISLPSWKIQDDYARMSRYPNRVVPDNLGSVGLIIHPEAANGSRVEVIQDYLYDHPAWEDEENEIFR